MEKWTIENSTNFQKPIAIGCMIIGFVLMKLTWGSCGFGTAAMFTTNSGAGFLLGFLVFALGFGYFFSGGKQKITVDPETRSIVVEFSNCFIKTKTRTIPFDNIDDMMIGRIGKVSNGMVFYWLVLKLKNGEEYPIFSLGYFNETNRSVVESWRDRLREYIKAELIVNR